MIGKERGFTLVELMITVAIFLIVIAGASGIFTSLLAQFKQQGAIAETDIEGIVGLEILRQDLKQAGYGLPWSGLIAYTESASNPYNLNDAPANPPRPVVSGNDVAFAGPNSIFSGTDYLVIKAVNVTRNAVSEKWTEVKDPNMYPYANPDSYNPRVWTPASENLNPTDRVIVLSSPTANAERRLITSGTFYTTFSSVTSDPWQPGSDPDSEPNETRLVYGINGSSDNLPVRPFNRADYFIRRFDGGGVNVTPQRCAPNTGVLFKASMNHDAPGTFTYLPLLDCVADLQVDFSIDTNQDRNVDLISDDIGLTGLNLNASQIRDRVREVRVYVVAHEGRRDPTFDFSMGGARTYLSTTEISGPVSRTINFRDLSNLVGDPEYKYYRWKLYVLSVVPDNLSVKLQ